MNEFIYLLVFIQCQYYLFLNGNGLNQRLNVHNDVLCVFWEWAHLSGKFNAMNTGVLRTSQEGKIEEEKKMF